MKSVTVGSSVDSSSKLQTLINNAGNTPTEYIFSENDIEINSTVKFYNNTKLTGNGVNLHLKDKALVYPAHSGQYYLLRLAENASAGDELIIINDTKGNQFLIST